MKVLLLSSPCSENNNPVFPLGLAYIASKIRGHEVHVFDPNTAGNPSNEATRLVRKIEPDVIGISLRNIDILYPDSGIDVYRNISTLSDLSGFVKEAKRISPMSKIVVGGPGFTLFAREIMGTMKEIDIGIRGEGEISFPGYLESMKTPGRVRGLYVRKGGEIMYTGKPETVDMDSLEFPEDLGFIDIGRYKNREVGIQTKRGCRFRCIYCIYPLIEGKQIRMRSPRKVADEIENIHNQLGTRNIFFTDSVFNIPQYHAKKVCEEIRNRKLDIKFNAYLRPDYVDSFFVKELIKSGHSKNLLYSFDALSQRVLNRLKKDLSMRTILDSCRLAKKFDMGIVSSVFSDVSFERPLTALETLKNMIKIAAIIRNPRKLCFRFPNIRIYPKTPIHTEAVNKGILKGNENLLYPLFYKKSLYGKLASSAPRFYKFNLSRTGQFSLLRLGDKAHATS
jgi:anaerobic magnesium-protoporphyrin IX monomethyl ester cyclase